MIHRLVIKNYRIFKDLEVEFDSGLNLVVGRNDVGKSTILEAVSLVLTGRLDGKPLSMQMSPYLFNQEATDDYLKNPQENTLPEIVIEAYLDEEEATLGLKGSNNGRSEDCPGVRLRAHFASEFSDEYAKFLEAGDITLIPAEYFVTEWVAFSGEAITGRSVPVSTSLIDASLIRLQSGMDYYFQALISNSLEKGERVELSRRYRSIREDFSDNPSIKAINDRLAGAKGDVSDRSMTMSIDISHRYTWESGLIPHLDRLPISFVGDGEHNSLKILLALQRKVDAAHVVLIEEPENHLSFSSLSRLVAKIQTKCEGKQVIIATHSSYVLNKLGLDHLCLVGPDGAARISDLAEETLHYFKVLPGYDTLRFVLAEKVILVEGPSDELLVQRAYRDRFKKTPMDAGVDVMSVGLSFARFLDIAELLGTPTAVVTDNDGDDPEQVKAGFSRPEASHVGVFVGQDIQYPTLEPQLLAANDLSSLNRVFGRDFSSSEELLNFMSKNKTACALAVLEFAGPIEMPEYIKNAIEF